MMKELNVQILFLFVECLAKRNYLVAITVPIVAIKVLVQSVEFQLFKIVHVLLHSVKLNVGCFLKINKSSYVKKYVRRERDAEIIFVKMSVAHLNSVMPQQIINVSLHAKDNLIVKNTLVELLAIQVTAEIVQYYTVSHNIVLVG